jgi:hypothetical protein
MSKRYRTSLAVSRSDALARSRNGARNRKRLRSGLRQLTSVDPGLRQFTSYAFFQNEPTERCREREAPAEPELRRATRHGTAGASCSRSVPRAPNVGKVMHPFAPFCTNLHHFAPSAWWRSAKTNKTNPPPTCVQRHATPCNAMQHLRKCVRDKPFKLRCFRESCRRDVAGGVQTSPYNA